MPGLKPGVYVKAKDSKRVKEAHLSPVGEIGLFKHHKGVLLTTANKNLAFWNQAFDDLMCLDTTEEGVGLISTLPQRLSRSVARQDSTSVVNISDGISDHQDEVFEAVPSVIGGGSLDSMAHPIPGGIDGRSLFLQEAEAFVVEVPQDVLQQEAVFLKLLVNAGPEFDSPMPAVCQIPHFSIQGYRAAKNLVKVANEFHGQSLQFGTQLKENLDAVTQLTLATKQIRKPVKSTLKEKNIWRELEAQNNAITLLQNKSIKTDEELEAARKRIKFLEEEKEKMVERFDVDISKVHESFVALENDISEAIRKIWKELRTSPDSTTTPLQEVSSNGPTPLQSTSPPADFDYDRFNAEARVYFTNRMDAFESKLNIELETASSSTNVSNELEAWKSQVQDLGDMITKVDGKVQSLDMKKQGDSSGESYKFGDVYFSSVICVNQFLVDNLSNLQPGIFVDPMVILEDLATVGDLSYDPVQSLKAKQISSNLGFSEATTNLICVNDLRSPQVFLGKKAGTTIKHSDWRNKSIIESGIAIDIATHLPEIKRRLEKAIELQFDSSNENDEKWRILALDMLGTSIDFVKQLAQYIDDMMRTLVDGGGNDAEEAWKIVMKAVMRIFEEYFAPVRRMPLNVIPKDQDPKARRQLFARLIWNSIQTFALTKKLLKTDIRHHHVVASAYTDWAIINSGKPEAMRAKEATVKMAAEMKELSSSLAAIKKTAGEAASTAKEAKKNADRACAKLK
jgi:hypothetical protein